MIQIDRALTAAALLPAIERMWTLSAAKLDAIEADHLPGGSTPVVTKEGRYVARAWTEWTRGFQFGSLLLQYDATGEARFLEAGRARTLAEMPPHATHFGVHDHGFNVVSTYGNLWRLAREGRHEVGADGLGLYELALRVSGAVQAHRWTALPEGGGYIHSFNGPHSLFADTIRSLRALALAHWLGQALLEEGDAHLSLFDRLVQHAATTARYSVYYGEGRDAYDLRGRTTHEAIFNIKSGAFRCPNSQQGFSPFTTWTRGLSWILCGYPEQLEFLPLIPEAAFAPHGGRGAVEAMMLKAARATADFYLEQTPTDGIPYWDTGAPALHRLGDYLDRPAEPFNDHEPVDSSAASTCAQGLIRLGNVLEARGEADDAARYRQAGLTITRRLLEEPYLATDPKHQGLTLHSVYHRPNGWDHIPAGRAVPCGEASMWGDYHMRELALLVQRMAKGEPAYTFFGPPTR